MIVTPTLHSHTHCQVTPAQAQAKTWQRVCLFQHSTDRQSARKKNTERLTAVLRNGGCSGILKVSFSNQVLWWVDSLVLRNPPLRKAAKRYLQA